MALLANVPWPRSEPFQFLFRGSPISAAWSSPRKSLSFYCRSSDDRNEDYLLDAPVSVGDGFSFSGGKYSDGPNPSDEWFKQGKLVKAHPVLGSGEKAKDPIFGLTMGVSSQAPSDVFRYMRNIYVTSLLSRLLKFWDPKLLGGVCDLLFK